MLARSLAGKILHGPVLAAREAALHGDDALLRQLASLFSAPFPEVPDPRAVVADRSRLRG